MATASPRLNPQPEPPIYADFVVISGDDPTHSTGQLEIMTPGGVLVVDLKTRRVTLKYPEKGDPRWSAAQVLGSAIHAWQSSKTARGLEALSGEAEQLLVAAAEAVVKTAVHK